MIDLEGNAGNYEQALAISLPVTKDYVDLIDNQAKSIEPSLDPDDVYTRFLKDVVNIDDISELEDNSIYIDPNIDELTKQCLTFFQDEIDSVLTDDVGISLQEPTIFLLKAIYNIFVLRVADYFIYFINGLQNTNEAFEQDLPEYKVYKYKYFLENISKKESEYQNILDYIQYITNFNFSFSNYISLALLESAGNVDLSALFIEDANYRVSADDTYFFNKIKKVILSPDVNDYVAVHLLDQIGIKVSSTESNSVIVDQIHD